MKKTSISRHATLGRHVRTVALGAILAALSFLLGLIAKVIQGTGPLRLTLEGLPIVFAGLVLGPTVGGLSGVCGDLLSCVLAGQAPNPLISLGTFAVGLIPGLLARLLRLTYHTPLRFPSLLLLDGAAHLIGSIGIKSIGLLAWYPLPLLLLRAPIYLGVILIESTLLFILLRAHGVRQELERILK